MTMYNFQLAPPLPMKTTEANQTPIDSLEDAIARCQELGMRVSRQRRYILELLWETRKSSFRQRNLRFTQPAG